MDLQVETKTNGEIAKHKARLIARGLLRRLDTDFDEVYAPVARLRTIKTVMSIASCKGWNTHQLDVKSIFLNGHLEEEVYVIQPPGFGIKGQESKVYKL